MNVGAANPLRHSTSLARAARALNGESMHDVIYKMITDIVENCVDISINDDADVEDWDFNELNNLLLPTIPLELVTAERVKKAKK